jgi:hypothetical protein
MNSNIPIFKFSLTGINPDQPPFLFSQIKKKSNRKPGMITNISSIRKEAVSNLLEVFRPVSGINQEIFNKKKNIVSDAIETMYSRNKVSD